MNEVLTFEKRIGAIDVILNIGIIMYITFIFITKGATISVWQMTFFFIQITVIASLKILLIGFLRTLIAIAKNTQPLLAVAEEAANEALNEGAQQSEPLETENA